MLIIENVNIVSGNVPLLFGPNLFEKHNLYVNGMKNILCCPALNVEISLELNHGHIYLHWNEASNVV